MHFSEIMIFSSRFGDVIYATELGLVPDELLVNDLRPLLTQSSLKYQKHYNKNKKNLTFFYLVEILHFQIN